MTTPSNYHMSLLYVVMNKFELNAQYYHCPENWTMTEKDRVKSPYLGVYFVMSGGIYLILYLLCFIAMLNRDLIRHPAYKIMVALALFDIPSVAINSLFSGYFGFQGIYFCDYPLLIFILGSFGFGLWLGCSFCCSALALCRISEINPGLKLCWIFKKPSIYIIMTLLFFLPCYGIFLTNPIIFRPEFMSWFFDPGTGQGTLGDYHNMTQVFNNETESAITTILYTYLVSYLIREKPTTISAQHAKMQRNVIIQAALICFFHSVSSSVYVYMQFFYSPDWLIIAAQIGWQICTGFISIIYLTLNQTIRSSVRKMIFPKQFQHGNQVFTFSDANFI